MDWKEPKSVAGVKLPKDLHRTVKTRSAAAGITVEAAYTDALESWLAHLGHEPITNSGTSDLADTGVAAELRRLADEQARLHDLISAQVVRVVNSDEKKLLERIVALAHRRDFMKRLQNFVKAEEMAVGQELIGQEGRKKAG